MQYIAHTNHDIYSGDRAHWRDIPVTSERPGPDYVPVIENNKHTGWEHKPNKEARIQELKTLLSSTDHKVLPDYKPKKSETKTSIKEKRKAWRKEVRELLKNNN